MCMSGLRGIRALFSEAAVPDLEHLLPGLLLPQLQRNEGRLCDPHWPSQLNSSVALTGVANWGPQAYFIWPSVDFELLQPTI